MHRWWRRKKRHAEIYPDEILLDSSTASDFNRDQFEGRIEQPLSPRTFLWSGTVVGCLVVLMLLRAGDLQIAHGTTYATQARENQLAQTVVFADRGDIVDRMGRPLAWSNRTSPNEDFAARVYAAYRGLSHVVGYAKAPAKDSSGFYYRDAFVGVDGSESAFDTMLGGQNYRDRCTWQGCLRSSRPPTRARTKAHALC
jgi:penicillin-binding protein 2